VTRNKKKVLIVDDDELYLYTTKELLQDDFIEALTHKSWAGATKRIKELQPDLVLLDLNMPVLSGDKLISIIKPYSDAITTPIVFYSSNDEDNLRELVKTHGAQGYICKGNITELQKKVNQYLKMQA
jgi:two-component system, OmpR family, response regulator